MSPYLGCAVRLGVFERLGHICRVIEASPYRTKFQRVDHNKQHTCLWSLLTAVQETWLVDEIANDRPCVKANIAPEIPVTESLMPLSNKLNNRDGRWTANKCTVSMNGGWDLMLFTAKVKVNDRRLFRVGMLWSTLSQVWLRGLREQPAELLTSLTKRSIKWA